jgi:hypothetical protein
MAELKSQFRKEPLTLADLLLLALCAAAIAYFSAPLIVKLSLALGEAAEPNKHADIQVVGVVVFLALLLVGIVGVFYASFVIGRLLFATLSHRARQFVRIGLIVLFLPVFIEAAKRGPQAYFHYLIDPSVRRNESKHKAKSGLELELRKSAALSVEKQPGGIKITNNIDQIVRVQVTFDRRVNQNIYTCYAGDSMTFPPDPSDEKMNLPPRESRLFLFADFHTTTGSHDECGFDDYAVWGWDEKSIPVFLSQKAHLF